MKEIVVTTILSCALTLGLVYFLKGAQQVTREVVLENDRVQVTERVIPVGAARAPHTFGQLIK